MNLNTEAENTGEDTADCEGSVRTVVNCRECDLAIALWLLVSKCSINPVINPNFLYSHSNKCSYKFSSLHVK
jgi:hypothetical protein